MALHDTYARITPYELFLPDPEFADERFPVVEEEAEERGADLLDPDAFVMLLPVGEALRDLRGPGDDPARIREHGRLLFHAYHLWRADAPLFLLSTAAARYVVEGGPEAAELAPPAPAGYLQLPWHLFWTRSEPPGGADAAADGREGGTGAGPAGAGGVAGGATGEAGETRPESVDGLFWVAGGGRLSVLVASGLRRDRPGFSVMPLPPVASAEASAWGGTTFRDDGQDFRSAMPGAELEGLYELRTPGEVLKLLVRAFAHLDRVEGAREEAAAAVAGGGVDAPPPSRLPFVRILLE